jgi:hypothetical protein
VTSIIDLSSTDRWYQANIVALVQQNIGFGIIGIHRDNDIHFRRRKPGKYLSDFDLHIGHRGPFRQNQLMGIASGPFPVDSKKSDNYIQATTFATIYYAGLPVVPLVS